MVPQSLAQPLETRAPAERSRKSWLESLCLVVVASAVTWLRLPAAGRDTLYAEDGSHFVNDWVIGGSVTTLFSPYAGYQHFVPRAATGLVTALLPVPTWANAVTWLACVVVGTVAALVYVASGSLTTSRLPRLALAAVVVMVPLAAEEAIANLANVHWYFLFLMPFVFLARPTRSLSSIAWGLVALVAALTEPQVIVFAPLAAWVLVRGRRAWPAVAGWALGLTAQAASYLSQPRPRVDGLPPVGATVKGYLVNAVLGSLNAHGRVVGAVVERTGWVGPSLVLLGFVAVAAVAMVRGGSRIRGAAVVLLLGSVAAWVGPYAFNNQAYLYYDLPPNSHGLPLIRWGMTASMCLLALVPLAAAALSRQSRRQRMARAALVGLVAVMSLSFVIGNDGRLPPHWQDEVSRGREVCGSGVTSVKLATSPSGYAVSMPCSVLER